MFPGKLKDKSRVPKAREIHTNAQQQNHEQKDGATWIPIENETKPGLKVIKLVLQTHPIRILYKLDTLFEFEFKSHQKLYNRIPVAGKKLTLFGKKENIDTEILSWNINPKSDGIFIKEYFSWKKTLLPSSVPLTHKTSFKKELILNLHYHMSFKIVKRYMKFYSFNVLLRKVLRNQTGNQKL